MNKLLYETEINEHSPIGRVTFEYAQDVTFDEIFEIFRQMALCMGFAEETVKEYFEDEVTDCDDKKHLCVDKIDIS